MSLVKTTAIVLKKMRLNEADNILTLFTSDGSKINSIAKGIRKTKSKFAGRLEPFSVVDLVLYEGKTFHTITQAHVLKDNKTFHDYDNYVTASAMSDLINQVTFEKGNDSGLYGLFYKSLELIDKTNDKRKLLIIFDWKVLQITGHFPNLNVLCKCENPTYLNLNGDGLVCQKCRQPGAHYALTDSATIKVLKYIKEKDIAELLTKVKFPNKTIDKITDEYLNYQLELKLKSRRVIGK